MIMQINAVLHKYVTIIDSQSNCKLTTVEGLFANCPKFETNKEKAIKFINEILGKCRILVYYNTISKPFANFIIENYPVYSAVKVPVGYGRGYQYHLFIKNPEALHMKMYQRAIREKVKKFNKRWRDNNKDKVKEINKRQKHFTLELMNIQALK